MVSRLVSFVFILAAFVTLSVQHNGQHPGPKPSQFPTCTYICPPTDLAGRPLKEHSNSNSQLFCRYKTNPNDYFCKYSVDNGWLKQDHDQQKCPAHAVFTCVHKKHHKGHGHGHDDDDDDGHHHRRTPAPPTPVARSPKPEIMKVRGELGKKKRRQ